MPQIILEYTANITEKVDFGALFTELHTDLHQYAHANIADCKSRVRKLDCFFMGDGDDENAFVSLTIYLLAGRSNEDKKTLGEAAWALLQRHYTDAVEALNAQITVRIADVDRQYYFKGSTPPPI